MRTDGGADRGTGMTKLIVAFCNFAKAPKMARLSRNVAKLWLIRATEKRDITPRQDLAPFRLPSQFLPPTAQQPQWTTVSSFSRLHYHTPTHHTREDSSTRVISLS
jgi:hypothetical protein